jgi:Fic family protein
LIRVSNIAGFDAQNTIFTDRQKNFMKNPFIPRELPLEDINWPGLIGLIAEASAALARYDGLLESIPDSEVLLSPLMTQEAVLSSKIEGTITTLEEVLEFEVDPDIPTRKEVDIKEVLNYRRALFMAKDELKERPCCLNLIKDVQYILLEGVRGKNKSRGDFRRTQNWIGKPGTPIEQATYIPPPADRLSDVLSNWERYYHHDEKERLVQLAIIHAQFEMIHPFLDGNGRIGRILIPIFLYDRRLLNSPVFYISAYFEARRDEYYSRLLAISESNDWDGWIAYFLKAIIEQAKMNIQKVKSIKQLNDEMRIKISSVTHSRFSVQTSESLFHQPVFTSTSFIANSRIPKPSAARMLKCLVDEGIISEASPSRGRKPARYVFPQLLRIIQND